MTVSLSIAKRDRRAAGAAFCLSDKIRRVGMPRPVLLAGILWVSAGWAGWVHATPGLATNAPIKSGPDEFAGSRSCQECHVKFYQLWSTSFHGLAMQPYTTELAKARSEERRVGKEGRA